MKSFGEEETIFENMDVLNPNEQTYQPESLPEREHELDQIHSTLRPVTNQSTPLNLIVYGQSGQGKTVAIRLKTDQLQEYADGEEELEISVVHIRCKGMDNSYHVLTHLVKALREERLGPGEELPSGHQRKQLLNMVLEELEKIGGSVIVVFDEIDAIGEDDYILYELPRANPEGVRLSLIGITNDLQFRENLDGDVRSSLGEDEVRFEPYDANQLRDILARRAAGALRDTYFEDGIEDYEHLRSDVLDAAIPVAAALGAQDTGDARAAIRLLFRAARFADDRGEEVITEDHVREARDFLETKAIESGIQTLPGQKMLALMSVTAHTINDDDPVSTTPAYLQYKSFCESSDQQPLSNRRFRDRLNDLADTNILNKHQGKGRGVENTYTLSVDLETALENLPKESERFGTVATILREEAGVEL